MLNRNAPTYPYRTIRIPCSGRPGILGCVGCAHHDPDVEDRTASESNRCITEGRLLPGHGSSELQQPIRVTMSDFFHVLRADRQRIQEVATLGVRAERIIHGKHDAVGSHDL
jgi:hypothetical protein